MATDVNNPVYRQTFEAYWLGYVESKISGGTGMDLKDIPSYIDIVKLAFSNLWPHNQVSSCFVRQHKHGWDYIKSGAEFLHLRGQRVMMSIIGTPDPCVSWNSIEDPQAFAFNAKQFIIDDLGLDGIDIDNEGSHTPNESFFNVLQALRDALGPKGQSNALLTCVSYIPGRDLPWLKKYGHLLDHVSLMAYWTPYDQMIALFKQYAAVLGPENVLIGVGNKAANKGQNTPIEEVAKLAAYLEKGGIMEWALSADDALAYAEAIHQNLPKIKQPL